MTVIAQIRQLKMLPRSTTTDLADGGNGALETSGYLPQAVTAFAHLVNLAHRVVREFRHAVLGACAACRLPENMDRVLLVFFPCHELKVLRPWVFFVAVLVVVFHPVRSWADEGSRYEGVDGKEAIRVGAAKTLIADPDARVIGALLTLGRNQDTTAGGSDSAMRTCFEPDHTKDWLPYFGHGALSIREMSVLEESW